VSKLDQYLNSNQLLGKTDLNIPSTIALLGHVVGIVVDSEVRGFLDIPSYALSANCPRGGHRMMCGRSIDVPSHCCCSVLSV
jgi:hypothetical protein